ncbi:MAG: DUF362 domain-containing protein [Thermoanaerobaculales bacterium]|jgi:uncharacterized protein (DUF362 family)|nr:DUF362 domain-containing protein [Thermoanaerobaculales bacterium]
MAQRRLTRRELAALAGGVALTGAASGRENAEPAVVRTARLPADERGRLDPTKVGAAMDAVLGGRPEGGGPPRLAASVFRSSDVVGIKLNCLGGRRLSPRPELVAAFVDRLIEGGVPPEQIILFERSSRELERAGFEIRRSGDGPRCFGVDNDYDRLPSVSGAIGSCFARLVSETCTALVSFGVVKDHDLAGVSAGMKNWYGVIHNPNKYHDHQCDPYVADVVHHPFIRSKLRLTVLDGVTAQCHGGPAFRASGIFDLNMLAASLDPVAADVWAWAVIDAERKRRGMPSLEAAGRAPRFLATAERYGLGVADPTRLKELSV